MNQYDEPHELEREFWHDEPTRQLRRAPTPPRARRHVATAAATPAARMRQPEVVVRATTGPTPRRAHDPFLVRVGIVLGVGLLALPIAASLRDGHRDVAQADDGAIETLSVTPESAAVLPDAVSGDANPSVLEPTSSAAPATTAPATTALPTTTAVPPTTALPTTTAVPATTVPATTVPATTAVPPTVTTPATTAAAAPAAPATITMISRSPNCSNTYGVVAGDSWIGIAKKVGTSTKQLLSANNASTSTMLYAGGKVCLPNGASAPAAPATTVKPSAPATTAPKAPTTTAPSAPVTTTPTVRLLSAAENEAIIRSVWPDDLEDEALRIARRESNLQNTAKNSCCYGLFQINWSAHRSWLAGIGVTSSSQLLDPNVNARAALTLYQRAGGFGPWAL
jgi:LysM repeat protein